MAKGDFQQVISNLLSNAIDACSVGGEIAVSASQGEGHFRLAIEDDGRGVPEDLKDKIFTPLFTTKQDVGTGLGLRVTKEIVEKYGGTITIKNSSLGAIFLVEFSDSHSH